MNDKLAEILSREAPTPLKGILPIYARCPVYSAGLIDWCAQHLDYYMDPEKHEYHTTVCYSKEAIPVKDLPTSKTFTLKANENGRSLKKFGDTLVLALGRNESARLRGLHWKFRKCGASHDFSTYEPHISLSKESAIPEDSLSTLPVYSGSITFGPCRIREIEQLEGSTEVTPHKPGKGRF